METSALSRQDRTRGLFYYFRHIFLNEIGLVCIADYVIILLAMCLGATNTQLGFIIAAMPAAGLVMLLSPVLFGGLRLIKVYFWLWLLRGICCLLYFAAIYLPERFADWRIPFLLTGYAGFVVFHNLAWPLKQTVERAMIARRDRGVILSKLGKMMNYGRIIAPVFCFVLLSIGIFSGQRGLLILSGIGIVLNTIAAFSLRGMPIRDRIESPNGSAFRSLLDNLRNRNLMAVALLYWCSIVLIIAICFLVPTLKNITELPFNRIFLFVAVAAVALIVSGFVARKFTASLESRVLLIPASISVVALSAVLAATPAKQGLFVILTGAAMMFVLGFTSLVIARLLLQCLPAENKDGFRAMLNFFGALIAMSAGFVFGKAADLELSPIVKLPQTYSIIFAGMAVIGLLMLLISLFLLRNNDAEEETNNNPPGFFPEILEPAVLPDFPRARTIFSGPEKLVLMQPSLSSAGMTADDIRLGLKSPLIRVKDDLINSLFFYPRPELLHELFEEAADRDSWWREAAIFALGAYPCRATEKFLLNIYRSETYPYLRSIAAKSLARIGNRILLPEVRDMLFNRPGLNTKTAVNLIISLTLMDESGEYLRDIFSMVNLRQSERFRRHVLIVFSRRMGCRPGMEHFLELESINPGSGIDELIGEISALPEFSDLLPQLKSSFHAGNYQYLLQWCEKLLAQLPLTGPFDCLRTGINSARKISGSRDEVIAAVFFTYTLLRDYRSGLSEFGGKPTEMGLTHDDLQMA